MPAVEKSCLNIKSLGVIAGSGSLPGRLLQSCDQNGIEAFVVAFEGQTDPEILEDRQHMVTRIGAAGHIIDTLKSHGIRDLVMVGAVRRPTLAELRPDLRTVQFFARLGMRAVGDNGLLSALRHELERDGFTIHGVHKFAEDLLAPEGPVGRCKPGKDDREDIERGLEVARTLGVLDVGQAAIVQEGIVLGVEGIEGTDELIRRCRGYRRRGRAGVLVKIAKPQQDRDLDLPTIGPDTVKLCGESGFVGIVVQAGGCLILDREHVVEIANQYGMFVVGVDLLKQKDEG